MTASARPYRRNSKAGPRAAARRAATPAPQLPSARPPMNTDSTIEVSAVVTPKLAMASRSQITSHTRLQNPETRKKTNHHRRFMGADSASGTKGALLGPGRALFLHTERVGDPRPRPGG